MVYYTNESAGAWRQRQKKYHKKVRTGCDTCRVRRVKCDEDRPRCKNCIRTSRTCTGVGYGTEDEAPQSEEVQSRSVVHVANSVPAPVVGGRVDPFNSFSIGPAPVAHQRIFDYAIHCQWTHFAPTQQDSDLAMVKKHVMTPILSSPVAYHSFLYSGACHAMFWSGSPIQHAELLRYKTQALHAMRAAIQSEGLDLTDETLFCMILLAAHGTADNFHRRVLGKVQGRKALMFTMDAEFYCALEIEWQHMEVFYQIMKRRELRAMSPGPLWTATAMFDVFSSWMHSRRPQLRPLVPMEMCPYLRTWTPDEISLELTRQANQEFAKVLAQMPPTILSEILHGLVIAMADMDHYRRTRTPVVESVIVSRSMYIRELLLLPDTIEASELQLSTYQMCRMACFLALQVWLFPDTGPNLTWTRNLPRKFVHKLPSILDRCLAVMLHETLSEFYTWTLIMGLMLAYEDFDNFGDREAMRKLVPYLDTLSVRTTPTAWNTIKCVVSRFLWCEEDCNETGKEAWEMACQMYVDGLSLLSSESSGSPCATSESRSVSVETVDLRTVRFRLDNANISA